MSPGIRSNILIIMFYLQVSPLLLAVLLCSVFLVPDVLGPSRPSTILLSLMDATGRVAHSFEAPRADWELLSSGESSDRGFHESLGKEREELPQCGSRQPSAQAKKRRVHPSKSTSMFYFRNVPGPRSAFAAS